MMDGGVLVRVCGGAGVIVLLGGVGGIVLLTVPVGRIESVVLNYYYDTTYPRISRMQLKGSPTRTGLTADWRSVIARAVQP